MARTRPEGTPAEDPGASVDGPESSPGPSAGPMEVRPNAGQGRGRTDVDDPAPPAEVDAKLLRDPLALAFLALALALGALVFVRLGRPGLWIDEAFTWQDANARWDNYNRAGYTVVLWTVELLGGVPTEAALRFAPAVAGWLAILATACALAPLAGARRAAAAACIVAASPWQLYWGQSARFYTFVELATLFGAGCLLRAIASAGAQGPRLVIAALGLASYALGALFQLQSVLALGALVGALLVLRPDFGAQESLAPDPARRVRRNQLVWRLGLAGLVLLALIAPAARDVFMKFVRSRGGGGGLGGVQHAVLALGHTIGPGLGAAFVLGAACALRSRGRRGALAVLVSVVGVGSVVVLGVVVTTTAQYAFVHLPWLALVAAWPVGRGEPMGTPWRAVAYVFLLTAPLLASSALQLGPRHGDRPRWREALAHVESRMADGDLVVSLPSTVAEHYLGLGRYARGAGAEARATRFPRRLPEVGADLDSFNTRTLERPARDGRAMWIIVRTDFLDEWPERDRSRLQAFLRDECRFEARFPVRIEARNLDIEVWRR
jgi:hypothetical protein